MPLLDGDMCPIALDIVEARVYDHYDHYEHENIHDHKIVEKEPAPEE